MRLTDLEHAELSKYLELYDFHDDLRGKTVLVTGSKGIVGSGIIRWLMLLNETRGTGVHIIASTRDVSDVPPYIEGHDAVVFCSFGDETAACAGASVDYVVHCAAPTSNKVFKAYPVESFYAILDGTRSALEVAREHTAVMVYLSSEEVYGTPDLSKPVSEGYVGAIDSLSTRSCYPLGKKAAELLCRSYSEEYGVDVRIVRPSVILGLWQPYDSVKVEAEIMRCVVEDEDLVMRSDGSTRKSVVYSLDAISAVLTVLLRDARSGVFNVTNPDTFCSVRERALSVFGEFSPNVSIRFECDILAEELGYLPMRSLLEDIGAIEKLGWRPHADMSYICRIDLERFGWRS